VTDSDETRGWPPDGTFGAGFRAPLFPLPNVFLFPGQVLPLHIFEPRYRQMVQDVLDTTGRIVVAPILTGLASDTRPEVLDLAGVGEIARFERLDDGRFLIWLVGLSRVRIDEIECDTPYRQVFAEPFEEVAAPPHEAEALRDELREAIRTRSALGEKLAEQSDVRILADVLAQLLELPIEQMTDLYCESSVAERARRALDAHRRTNDAGSDDGATEDE
jgi:Lon protease-like protein